MVNLFEDFTVEVETHFARLMTTESFPQLAAVDFDTGIVLQYTCVLMSLSLASVHSHTTVTVSILLCYTFLHIP